MTTGKEKQSGEDFPALDMRLRVAYEFYKEFLVPFMAKGEGLTADRLTQLIS